MSIFGSIVSKIFHHGGSAPPAGATVASAQSTVGVTPGVSHAAAPASAVTPPVAAGPSATTPPASAPPATSATADAGTAAPASVDVAAILNDLAAKSAEKLDWRHSIVDMMKLLGLDSSLGARQSLAQELHYSGDTHDSASMNVWLHKQVMTKLAENGGKVPDDLRG